MCELAKGAHVSVCVWWEGVCACRARSPVPPAAWQLALYWNASILSTPPVMPMSYLQRGWVGGWRVVVWVGGWVGGWVRSVRECRICAVRPCASAPPPFPPANARSRARMDVPAPSTRPSPPFASPEQQAAAGGDEGNTHDVNRLRRGGGGGACVLCVHVRAGREWAQGRREGAARAPPATPPPLSTHTHTQCGAPPQHPPAVQSSFGR